MLVCASLSCADPPTLTIDDMASADAWSSGDAGPTPLRKLTSEQYRRVVLDLFGDAVAVPPVSEPDVVLGGLIEVGGSGATYSPRGVESLENAAYSLAEQVFLSPEARAPWMSCTPTVVRDDACSETVLSNLGRVAFRRELTPDEADRLVAAAGEAAIALGDFYEGLVFGVAAILQSPKFVYRVELGEVNGSTRAFTAEELASKLSFFLWNTAPDATLLEAAEAGELDTDEGFFEAAATMLDDDRSIHGVRAFFTDHLELYVLDDLHKDPAVFEHFSEELGPDSREETLRLMAYFVLDGDLDYRDVLTTNETWLNPRMATLYDLPSPSQDDWKLVALPPEANRAGLLGHGSLLQLHAHSTSSSATLRGKAVRTTLLCQAIPAPPVDVDTSIPEPSGETPTLRDRVAEHLENPSCAGCHKLTDPIGLGLENYDGIGRWRATDNGVTIDATGDLDGAAFVDAISLGEQIRNHDDFAPCLVRTMGRYVSGRIEGTTAEREWLETLSERFAHHDYRVRMLMLEVVMSPLFRRPGDPQ